MEKRQDCPLCKGAGWIEWTESHFGMNYEYAKPCICRQREWQLRRMEQSNLINITGMTLESFKAKEDWQIKIAESAMQFVAYEPHSTDEILPWFFIGGMPGTGKTHLCTGICGKLLEQGRHVRYEVWPELAADLKAKMNTYEFGELMKRLQTVDVLYLDDLFRGGPTRADANLAWTIINGRYNGNRQTIISAECHIQRIMDMDSALGSRIFERTRGFRHIIANKKGRNQRTEQPDAQIHF